jgi:hypothetical protein
MSGFEIIEYEIIVFAGYLVFCGRQTDRIHAVSQPQKHAIRNGAAFYPIDPALRRLNRLHI